MPSREEIERLDIQRILGRTTAVQPSVPLNPAQTTTRIDPFTGRNVTIPSGASNLWTSRDAMTQNGDGYGNIGSEPTLNESELTQWYSDGIKWIESGLTKVGQEGGLGDITDIGAGIESQVTSLFTRVPGHFMKEFSDLIGDDAKKYPGIVGDMIGGLDNIADEWGPELLKTYQIMAADNNWTVDAEGNHTFLFNLGSGGASLAEALALTYITRSPKAAAIFFGAIQQSETYSNAIAAGKTPQEAFLIADAAGIMEGALEFMGIGALKRIMQTPGRRAVKRFALGALTESLQEGAQTASSVGIEHFTDVTPTTLEDALTDIKGSAFIGGLLGGGASSVGGGIGDARVGRRARTKDSIDFIARSASLELGEHVAEQLQLEQDVFNDARLAIPTTESGRKMKSAMTVVDQMFKANMAGREVSDVYRTEKQQEEYVEGVIGRMQKLGVKEARRQAVIETEDITAGIVELTESRGKALVGGNLVEVSAIDAKIDSALDERIEVATRIGSPKIVAHLQKQRATLKESRESTDQKQTAEKSMEEIGSTLNKWKPKSKFKVKRGKTERNDFNDAIAVMARMAKAPTEAFNIASEYANQEDRVSEYSGMAFRYADLLGEGREDSFRMGEFLNELNFMIEEGYLPDIEMVGELESRQEDRDSIQEGSELRTEAEVNQIRRGPLYAIQDGFFNPLIQTLNTLWTSLGVNGTAMESTKNEEDKRNLNISFTRKLDKILKKVGLTTNDMHQWEHADSQVPLQWDVVDPDTGEVDPRNMKLTKGQIIQRLMSMKNKQQREQAMNPKGSMGYTEDLVQQMEDSLDGPEAKFIDEIMAMYKEAADLIAPVYRRVFKVSMPRVKDYAPSPKKGRVVEDINPGLFGSQGMMADFTPGLLKGRVRTLAEFADVEVGNVIRDYFSEVAHFVHMTEKINHVRAVVLDEDTGFAIKEKIGVEGYGRLLDHLRHLENSNNRNSNKNMGLRVKLYDHMNKVYIVNKLMFKPNMIGKQMSSMFGMTEDMPIGETLRRLPGVLKNMPRWRKTLRQHDSIANRSKHIDSDYNAILGKGKLGYFGENNKWLDFGMKFVAIGDVSAIYAGGGMYYDYLIENGMSPEEALEKVVNKAEASQQSTLPSNMSLMQKSNEPFTRTIRMFTSSTVALMNMQMKAYYDFHNGDITIAEFAKKMAIYQVVIPSFYAYIGMGMKNPFEEPEEIAADFLYASMKGNAGAIPFVDGGWDLVATAFANNLTDSQRKSFGIQDTKDPITEAMRFLNKSVKRSLKDDPITTLEVLEGIAEMADLIAPLGAENLMNGSEGLYRVFGEELSQEDIMRIMGYSKRQAKERIEVK